MAAPTQYGFELREVATALIKQQNIHEGRWWAAFEFALGSGLFGAAPPEVLPGAMFQIRRVLLAQADQATPQQFVVDASEVNPVKSVVMASGARAKK
jgi:hypothetical protein